MGTMNRIMISSFTFSISQVMNRKLINDGKGDCCQAEMGGGGVEGRGGGGIFYFAFSDRERDHDNNLFYSKSSFFTFEDISEIRTREMGFNSKVLMVSVDHIVTLYTWR